MHRRVLLIIAPLLHVNLWGSFSLLVLPHLSLCFFSTYPPYLQQVGGSMWNGGKRKRLEPKPVTFVTGNANKLKEVRNHMPITNGRLSRLGGGGPGQVEEGDVGRTNSPVLPALSFRSTTGPSRVYRRQRWFNIFYKCTVTVALPLPPSGSVPYLTRDLAQRWFSARQCGEGGSAIDFRVRSSTTQVTRHAVAPPSLSSNGTKASGANTNVIDPHSLWRYSKKA